MSFLRTASQPVATPVYTGLQLQTSSGAIPIAIVYGVNKIAPNVLWNGNFQAHYDSGKGSGGGKGGGAGGGKGNSSPSSYSTAIIFGLCEGPIGRVSAVWDNSTIAPLSNVSTMTSPSFINGATPQAVWSYLSGNFPAQALAYNGTALLVDYQISLGSSATVDSYSFELQAVANGSGFNGYDADPALVIQDFLTNAQYGVGFPAASIDATTLLGASGDASYQSYCKATGLALSPAITDQEAANSVLARWLQLTNTAAVWSSGLLKFIPYGDSALTGPLYSGGGIGFGTSNTSQSYTYLATPKAQIGTCSFNPNLTPVYDLSDDDFVATDGDDPIQVERSDPYAAHNMQTLEISQRSNYYDATPITVFDQNAIELYGLRIASTITAHEICDAGVAQTSGQLILQRDLYIRNHYTLKLSWEYCLLEPMDLVTLTDANLGLSNAVVRITDVEEADDGILTFTAEEFPAGIATAVAYPVQTQTSSTIATNGNPGSVNPPLIFEPPSALTGGSAQIWAAVSGGVPSAYKLAETATSGVHQCSMILDAQPSGALVSFTIEAQAVERTACILEINNGSATLSCVFDLAAVTTTSDLGVTSASIIDQGGGWYQLAMSVTMTATATPILSIGIESGGASNYAGTSGSGFYFWNASFAAGSEIGASLPAFTSVTGASVTAASVTTPLGQAGSVNPIWGGANIWVSLDGTSYSQIGSLAVGTKQGVLSATLSAPATANPDVADTLSVNLAESGGVLSSTSAAGAQNAATLSIVDNELLSFETATLSGSDTYNLTTLYRGLYGTAATAHTAGAPFARLDTSIFEFDLPGNYIGQTIYLKFQSFNIFGSGLQDLAACAVYSFTPTGQGVSDPITAQLATHVPLDLGLVTQTPAAISGDLGVLVGALLDAIDLGTIP